MVKYGKKSNLSIVLIVSNTEFFLDMKNGFIFFIKIKILYTIKFSDKTRKKKN